MYSPPAVSANASAVDDRMVHRNTLMTGHFMSVGVGIVLPPMHLSCYSILSLAVLYLDEMTRRLTVTPRRRFFASPAKGLTDDL